MKVLVLINTYGGGNSFEKLVKDVCQENKEIAKHFSDIDIDVVVVDNGSPNNLPIPSEVITIRHEENMPLVESWQAAFNRLGLYDIYIVMEDGIAKRKNKPLISGFIEAFKLNPNVGIASLGTDDKFAGALYVSTQTPNNNLIINHVDMACWAWTHAVVDSIGHPKQEGHPNHFGWYINKVFCYRARKKGFDVMAAKEHGFYHHIAGKDGRVEKHIQAKNWMKGLMGKEFMEAW